MFELFIGIVVGSLLITFGVNFIPVGGSSASVSKNAGITTTAPVISLALGMVSILGSLYLIRESPLIVMLAGAVTSMMVMAGFMFFSNIIQVFGVGVVPASSGFQKDPLTGYTQNDYITIGTEGHGIPSISFLSGLIGSLLFGSGGSMVFYVIYDTFSSGSYLPVDGDISIVLSVLSYFIIAVIASYNSNMNNQGFYDKNFLKNIKGVVFSCFIISVLIAVLYTIIIGGISLL